MGATGGHKRHHNSDKGERPHDGNSTYHGAKQHGHEKQNSQNSLEKAKNVSHVPCKFFRQSICQAGDKCPFSHDLDNDHPAVCKYFQKGNCKFGSKCALAHITPDGKHVNKHTRESKRKEHKEDDSLCHTASRNDGASGNYARHETSHCSHAKAPGRTDNAIAHTTESNIHLAQLKVLDGTECHTNESGVSVEKASMLLSKYNDANLQSPVSRSYSDIAINSRNLSRIGLPENVEDIKSLRTLSHDASISATTAIRETTMLAPSPWSNISTMVDGSAIADDDDDDIVLESSNTDEEDDICEQLVPSTLEDLLTPRERERRKSRETLQKPGRVLSSPSSKKAPLFTFRRGSAPMTESTAGLFSSNVGPLMTANNINHLPSKARSVSNSSNSVSNSSGARGNDLWSPRNLDTPFSRPPGFNSPLRNPGAVSSGTLFASGMKQTPLKYQVCTNSGSLTVGAPPPPLFKQHESYMGADQLISAQNHVGPLGATTKIPMINPHLQMPDPLYTNAYGSNYGDLDVAANVGNHRGNGLQSYTPLATEKT